MAQNSGTKGPDRALPPMTAARGILASSRTAPGHGLTLYKARWEISVSRFLTRQSRLLGSLIFMIAVAHAPTAHAQSRTNKTTVNMDGSSTTTTTVTAPTTPAAQPSISSTTVVTPEPSGTTIIQSTITSQNTRGGTITNSTSTVTPSTGVARP